MLLVAMKSDTNILEKVLDNKQDSILDLIRARDLVEEEKKKRDNLKKVKFKPRVCKVCGHEACSACYYWCDMILPNGKCCCNGNCTYDD